MKIRRGLLYAWVLLGVPLSVYCSLMFYAEQANKNTPCLASGLGIYRSATPIPLLQQAQEDIGLLMRGEQPRHARFLDAFADGGSVRYGTADYALILHQQLYQLGNTTGYQSGFSIRFQPASAAAISPVSETNQAPAFGHSWFEPAN